MADYPGLTYPETPAAEAETLSLMAFYIQDGFVWLGVLYFSLHYCCSKTASNLPEQLNYNSNVNGNSPTRDSSGRRRRLDSINDDDDGDDNGGDGDAAGDAAGDGNVDADAAADDTLLTMAAPSDDSSMVGANTRRWRPAGGGGRIAWMDTLRVFLTFSIVTYNICCV